MGAQRLETPHHHLEQPIPRALPFRDPARQGGRVDLPGKSGKDRALRGVEFVELGQGEPGRLGDLAKGEVPPASLGRKLKGASDHMLPAVGGARRFRGFCRPLRLGHGDLLDSSGQAAGRPGRPPPPFKVILPRRKAKGAAAHLIEMTCPPVMRTSSSGVSLNTALGVPAAAQISPSSIKSASMKVVRGCACPRGGTPPITKPVRSRTKEASALPSFSPRAASTAASLTRFGPLATTSTGRPEPRARKTIDLAIWLTVQPTAAAASAELRVGCACSTISFVKPRARKASSTFRALGLNIVSLIAGLPW